MGGEEEEEEEEEERGGEVLTRKAITRPKFCGWVGGG